MVLGFLVKNYEPWVISMARGVDFPVEYSLMMFNSSFSFSQNEIQNTRAK
jgi:hypothetical protein